MGTGSLRRGSGSMSPNRPAPPRRRHVRRIPSGWTRPRSAPRSAIRVAARSRSAGRDRNRTLGSYKTSHPIRVSFSSVDSRRPGGQVRAAGRVLIVSLAVGCAAMGQGGSPAVPSYGIYYRLTIRLDPARGTIRGDVWIATRSSATVRAERLFAAPTLVIDSILSDRVPATVFRRGDTVTFTPPSARAGGGGGRSEVVQVFYHGTASPPALSMEPHAGAPAASTYGLPYAARAWWPAPGSTLAKADSADVTITVPGHL